MAENDAEATEKPDYHKIIHLPGGALRWVANPDHPDHEKPLFAGTWAEPGEPTETRPLDSA